MPMKPTFLTYEKPLLTTILQCRNPETAKYRITKALELGADAFGLQTESLLPEYRNEETIRDIFSAMGGKPIYATRYRPDKKSDAEDGYLGQEILKLADWGATLCDVMGDLYAKHPDELTMEAKAVDKQRKLIDSIHEKGAEVLMSSHLYRYAPAERILEIGLEQERRGAEVVKIVTKAENPEQLLDNIRANILLKENLKVPFLFLSSGSHGNLLRRIGPNLGCCMYLCVYEHDDISTKAQPLLEKLKPIRDNMEWYL